VSYGIIRQHHGEIAVESEEGQGTAFTLKIPAKGKEKGE
jgi:signal transduction histidine kinase